MTGRIGLLVMALLSTTAAAQTAAARSGYEDMSPQTQAMQRDDALNPGLLWVQEGASLWARPQGAAQRACSGCHADATASMRGVAARYPAYDTATGGAVNLSQRINLCRERHQQAPPWAPESQPLLALESFVAHQSRGLPMAPVADPRLEAARARGAAQYRQRIGQLDLSCAQCHDERAGLRLGGSTIPQGRANGYPVYRLEWQGLGSLQRRLRNCMTGVRAEPHAYASQALVDLEIYLAGRDRGMAIETPAVRP